MSSVRKFINTIKGKPKKTSNNKHTNTTNSNSNNNNNSSNNNSVNGKSVENIRPKLSQEQIQEALLKRGPSKSGRYKVATKKRGTLPVQNSSYFSHSSDHFYKTPSNEHIFNGHEVADEIANIAYEEEKSIVQKMN